MHIHSNNPIGGYFEVELPPPQPWIHDSALLLNSGRAALEYVLRTVKPTLIHIPKFTCHVLLEPIKRTGTAYHFYSITPELEITDEPKLQPGELLLYTNYFGVKDIYCSKLAELYGGQLVLDFSQAFFSTPPACAHTFYSPRKFVGVPDGGCLYTTNRLTADLARDVSFDRYTHLVGRYDLGAEAAYPKFKANDAALVGEGLKRMSASTERLLGTVDFNRVLIKRQENFELLHQALGSKNYLNVDLSSILGPMVYPFFCNWPDLRKMLVKNKIFVATYWSNVFDWCDETEIEWQFAANLIPLPIDQRYGHDEMRRIVDLILSALALPA